MLLFFSSTAVDIKEKNLISQVLSVIFIIISVVLHSYTYMAHYCVAPIAPAAMVALTWATAAHHLLVSFAALTP